MCIRDFQEMKSAKSSFRSVSVSTTTSKIVAYSPHRIALIIGAPFSGVVNLFKDVEGVVNQGLFIAVNGPPLILTTKEHGDLPTRDWFATMNAGTSRVAIIEVFDPGDPRD